VSSTTATGGDAPLPAPAPGLDLYDTTLRDGTQREGVTLSVEDKLRVARRMDELGVAYIEGGWPGANPKDTEFFARAADGELQLGHATLVAFGMTRGAGRRAEADPLIQALVDARTDVVCLVGKSWGYHVDEALGVARQENLDMVADSISHLRELGKRVFFDAEHFFDGFTRDGEYAREVVLTAAEAGAECVVLCDTNGGAMPWDVSEIVHGLVGELSCDVGLHFHDDGGCAVANSLLGIEAGAVHVQGTANGLGERCGNANLFTLLADLQLKRGLPLVPHEQLERLTETSHVIAELCNQTTPSTMPYVGHTAFSHKAGIHASALAKAPDMYQHIDPDDVGNRQRLVVSELAGRSNVLLKAKELGLEITDDQAREVLAEVKRREAAGWTYEAADASFDLLLRRVTGVLPERDEPFRFFDGGVETCFRVAQHPLRGSGVHPHRRVVARHRRLKGRYDHVSECHERAGETQPHIPIATTKLRSQVRDQAFLLPCGHEDDGGAPCGPRDLVVIVVKQRRRDRRPRTPVADL
jgi:2-isopropylmalate synthase